MVHIEISEIPELPGPSAEYLRAAKISLIVEQERAAANAVRLKFENEDDHEHKHKHPHGHWYKHARDHNHHHKPHDESEQGPQHGHWHKPVRDHKHDHKPHDQSEQGPQHGPKHGPMHMPKHEPMHGPSHEPDCEANNRHKHGSPHHGHKKGSKRGPPPPYVEDPNAPKDKGQFVLSIIGLFGLVHMMPMMFFFTANEYWMYKFRDTTSNSTDANDRTYLQTNFASLTKLTVTAPGVICNLIAAVGGHKISAQTRVFWVLGIHSSILIAQAIFANIDTDDWQFLFFGITMALQMVMACAMSLGGSGSMGLISKLPPRYMKAQLMGEGISGVFSSVLRLISIFCTPSTVGAALMYFITGSVLMVLTSVIFYFATQTTFFKYYTRSSKEEQKQNIRNVGDFKIVLKILWPMIVLNFIPMLFPVGSITNLVVSEYYGTDSVWGNKYFITFCTYLIPAITGLIGRGIFSYMDYDCNMPMLYGLVLSRDSVFGTLLLLSNAKPRHHLTVLLQHDWQYALMIAGNSLTQGFIMTLCMMKTMRMVPKDRIELSMMCNMVFMSIFSAATSPLGVVIVNII